MVVRTFSTTVRAMVAGALVLGSIVAAAPAGAHVVEVTTALELADANDASEVKAALRAAVERVLANTIAFRPTMVTLTDARVVGERLLVRLLIADADGERMLQDLQSGSASPDEEDEDHDAGDLRV